MCRCHHVPRDQTSTNGGDGVRSAVRFDAMTSPEQQEEAPLTVENNAQSDLNVNDGAPLRKVRKKMSLPASRNSTDDADA